MTRISYWSVSWVCSLNALPHPSPAFLDPLHLCCPWWWCDGLVKRFSCFRIGSHQIAFFIITTYLELHSRGHWKHLSPKPKTKTSRNITCHGFLMILFLVNGFFEGFGHDFNRCYIFWRLVCTYGSPERCTAEGGTDSPYHVSEQWVLLLNTRLPSPLKAKI